jgi:hypothetical protein
MPNPKRACIMEYKRPHEPYTKLKAIWGTKLARLLLHWQSSGADRHYGQLVKGIHPKVATRTPAMSEAVKTYILRSSISLLPPIFSREEWELFLSEMGYPSLSDSEQLEITLAWRKQCPLPRDHPWQRLRDLTLYVKGAEASHEKLLGKHRAMMESLFQIMQAHRRLDLQNPEHRSACTAALAQHAEKSFPLVRKIYALRARLLNEGGFPDASGEPVHPDGGYHLGVLHEAVIPELLSASTEEVNTVFLRCWWIVYPYGYLPAGFPDSPVAELPIDLPDTECMYGCEVETAEPAAPAVLTE